MQRRISLPEYPCREDLWDKLQKETRPIVVYGMGNGADKLLTRLDAYGVEISDIFASDGFVRGHSFHGIRVKSFSEIKAAYSDFVILLSFASSREEVIALFEELDGAYELYIPDMPVVGEEYFDRTFYNENYERIVKAYEALSDGESRDVFASVLRYKLSGRLSDLFSAVTDKDEMYRLFDLSKIRFALDAGAYNGDTVRESIRYFENLERIVAVEPDPKTFRRLLKTAEGITDVTVLPVNAAVHSIMGNASFHMSGNRNSSLIGASHEHRDLTVPLVTVDGLSSGGRVDYIKYDVEGAEYEALLGSDGTIKRSSPALLISAYHKSRDIFDLVLHMKESYPQYDLYYRRLRCVPAWDLNLLAVPRRETKNVEG